MTDRHIPLTGSKNFRDFGGYASRYGGRVKMGQLFRSDSLARLSDEDLHSLASLNIRTICDLRRQKERDHSPTRWHENSATHHLHLPLLSEDTPSATEKALAHDSLEKNQQHARQVMLESYQRMVSEPYSQQYLRQIFLLIARNEELPILIHCSGGKDRTGISSALILTALGVEEEDIFEDYMLSKPLYCDRINLKERASSQVFDHEKSGSWHSESLHPIYAVEPAYLDNAFEQIRKNYGNVDRFIERGLGITPAEIEQIRLNLLE